jgi:signal transduction histidine kinase
LIVIKGTDEGKQFELTESVQGAGRDASNRIRLTDTEASRRHAEFRQTPEGYRLTDGYCVLDGPAGSGQRVPSSNGTFVNGQKIQDVLLQPGDQVQIGQTVMIYSTGRGEGGPGSNLADRISLIARSDLELSSAIIKTVGEAEGSRILSRPQEAAQDPWLRDALANLGVMYETSQAISHILDLNLLLQKIMDLIFSRLAADRGCIMLRNPETGELEAKAVRERVASQDKMQVSRTILDYMVREKKGVLVSDASRDERFSSGQSILRFGVREVICVPLKGRYETLVGVLYLDTRSTVRDLVAANNPEGKFSESHLTLAAVIAHVAALAVESTRYHQAMIQAERLAAIGQAIAGLGHHLKNILQGLRSGSEILKMGLTDKDDACLQQGWKMIERNRAKIDHVVMDMLSYSKEREPAVQETDVNALVREVVEHFDARAKERGIKLMHSCSDKVPLVPIDRDGINHALLNVVSNALDAVEDRKGPAVRAETALEDDGNWVLITVKDNGAGIPPEKLEDIFKPFVSSKGARGTGLGLPVSRKILREHGGDIVVRSQVNKGTHFLLRLPLKSPLTAEASGLHATLVAPLPPPRPPLPPGPAADGQGGKG